jgi:LacI family transcriptional regulator
VVHGRRLPNYCCVLETPGEGGRRAAEILLAAGRRKFVVLMPTLLTQITADRVESFVTTIRAATGHEPERVTADFTPDSAAQALRAYLGAGKVCNALFAVTDTLAIGAYQAIKDAGLRIPKDVAVIGVGDHEHVDYFDPPLTCVGPVNDTVVERVATVLFHLMTHRRVKPTEFLVPPAIVRRASV